MDVEFNRQWLIAKFAEIRKRLLEAIGQLNDEQVNWRPYAESNSIANLVIHIEGNIRERIEGGIHGKRVERNREREFEPQYKSRAELRSIVNDAFEIVSVTLSVMTQEDFGRTQLVRNKEKNHLDILHQCASHFSEHLGQVLYVAKMLLDDRYVSTSIPRQIREDSDDNRFS